MQVNISGKVVVGAASTVLLSIASWLVLGHIEYGNRITRLESSGAQDARQDSELADIRATVRDLIRLESANHIVTVPVAALEESPAVAPLGPNPETGEDESRSTEYRDFRTEQADLESVLRSRGIEPTKKLIRDPRRKK